MINDVKVDLNIPKIKRKVTNDKIGLFIANEWKRLINPYTPRRTGTLEDTALIRPFEIEYIQPYSLAVYHGEYMNFRTDNNPFATYEWDKKAAESGQQEKLANAVTKYLDRR